MTARTQQRRSAKQASGAGCARTFRHARRTKPARFGCPCGVGRASLCTRFVILRRTGSRRPPKCVRRREANVTVRNDTHTACKMRDVRRRQEAVNVRREAREVTHLLTIRLARDVCARARRHAPRACCRAPFCTAHASTCSTRSTACTAASRGQSRRRARNCRHHTCIAETCSASRCRCRHAR